MTAVLMTGWQGVAAFVTGLLIGGGAVSWYLGNRALEATADQLNDARWEGWRAGLSAGHPPAGPAASFLDAISDELEP